MRHIIIQLCCYSLLFIGLLLNLLYNPNGTFIFWPTSAQGSIDGDNSGQVCRTKNNRTDDDDVQLPLLSMTTSSAEHDDEERYHESEHQTTESATANSRRNSGDGDSGEKPQRSEDLVPVFMVPSMAGTRLRVWSDVNCGGMGLLNSFRVGGTAWLDLKRLLAQPKCWIRCLKLDGQNMQDNLCVTRPDEGVDAITQVDESVPAGFLWKAAIHMLASNGYEPGKSMFATPYDWRLAPGKMEERDRSFSRLKLSIEQAVSEYKDRNRHSPIRGVVLTAFSMGNLFLQYFFKYLEAELGRKGLERWVDKHVYALIMGGAPFLGTSAGVDSIIHGDTAGLPITREQMRDMMLTWGSMPWLMPHKPKVPNPRHSAMNHGETDFTVRAVELITHNGTVFRPENNDVVKTGGWLGKVGDPRLSSMQNLIDEWYSNDPLIDGGDPKEPWTPPKGIDHIVCSYGVNVPTSVGNAYKEDNVKHGYFDKVDEAINDKGFIFSRSGKPALPENQQYVTRKSGDGSVDYFSLSWCHSWFGTEVVNITKIPANRQYEEDEIEQYDNVNVLDPAHLSATESRLDGMNTFFARKWTDVHPENDLQRPRSIQVWELDAVGHRESVTNPLFLRLWKNVLLGASKLTRIYVSARERTTQQLWEEMDTSGALENFNYFSVENFTREGAFSHSKGNLPTSDQDCYWNYGEVRCEWPRYCEYKLQMGDVHLSQSCRLRKTPLAKDDPSLLLLDAVAHNVSYNVAPDRVEWRTVYRNREPGLLRPWALLVLAFLGGATVLGITLFIAFLLYSRRLSDQHKINELRSFIERNEKRMSWTRLSFNRHMRSRSCQDPPMLIPCDDTSIPDSKSYPGGHKRSKSI